MRPDPEKIRVWEARAHAYDRLCRRWRTFPLLSSRLVDLLPSDLHGRVLDVGAGSGLTSELLLDRHPGCESILIEPSEAMLGLARERLAGRRAQFLAMGLDGVAVAELRAAAAISSAALHFLDLDEAFATLERIIEPGGHLAFNLWWHHWEDTAALECMTGWQPVAEAACREAGLPPPAKRAYPVPVAKTRAELSDAARSHGFRQLLEERDEDATPVAYGVDFLAMDPVWPVAGLGAKERQAVLHRMDELAQGKLEPLVSTRFLFQRDDRR
jgi:SAM-dependent methyltransferase